jgi:3-oxoacyl-[acyl-carrier protein] reductase
MSIDASGRASQLPLPAQLSLQGRRVAVTGAASGIGRATAQVAAKLGASLVLCDIAPLQEMRAGLERSGVQADTLEADLTQKDFAAMLLERGPIHGLAHCAAIYSTKPLQEESDLAARFAHTMDINCRVPIELGLACAEHMAGNGGGSIVMLGSVAGRTGGTAASTPVDYAASKGAVHTAVRWLSRKVVGRGVLVNGIAPGPVATPMTVGVPIDPAALPMGRFGRPEEIAWMAAFLLSPAASYISGAIFDVNGGTYVG